MIAGVIVPTGVRTPRAYRSIQMGFKAAKSWLLRTIERPAGQGLLYPYKYVYSQGMADKPVFWLGSALDAVREFPARARRLAGHQLGRVQAGMLPSDWKPMRSIGQGVHELRIRTDLEHRVIYVTRFSEGIYVLHAFEKRSRKTHPMELELARKRLRTLVAQRGGEEEH